MVDNIEFQELPEDVPSDKLILSKRDIGLCGHVKINAEILLGEVELTIEELFSLKQGSVVESLQPIDAPMSLLIDGKLVAKGTLVVVDDKFGFEVSDIIE